MTLNSSKDHRLTFNIGCPKDDFKGVNGHDFIRFLCIQTYTDSLSTRPVHNESSTDFSYINVTRTFMRVSGVLQFLYVPFYVQSSDVTNRNDNDTIDDNCYDNGINDESHINQLRKLKLSHSKGLTCGHININGLRSKFTEICDLFTENIFDILFIGETKLDSSFTTAQFTLPEFKTHRADRNQNGGGIMLIIRSDIPCRRLKSYEDDVIEPIESLVVEVMVRKEKWLFICLYNPNFRYRHACCETIEKLCTRAQGDGFSMVSVLGDANINMTCKKDAKCLYDTMEICGLKNIIDKPTCFKSSDGTLLDVILTTSSKRFSSVINIDTGISDFHNLIGFITKIHVPRKKRHDIVYRSYKHFDDSHFRRDIAYAPYHVSEIFDEEEDIFWFHDKLISEVINDHAPLKKKRPIQNPVPYMNSKLRKAQHYKNMLRNKYFRRGRTKGLWESYRKSRNQCTKIKAISVQSYFDSRCNKSQHGNGNEFWNTIKPFMTDKSKTTLDCIMLDVNGVITSDPKIVCDTFNTYFCNVAQSIGITDALQNDDDICTILQSYNEHSSIKSIRSKVSFDERFAFHEVSECHTYKLLKNLNPKKATGCDNVPAKLLKLAAKEFSMPVTNLINSSIRTSIFPGQLKRAEVSPLYKSKDDLNRQNYRPISILSCISKLYERTYYDQLYSYFENIFAAMLSAYRPRYGCQHVLLKLIEDWKCALDNKCHIGAIFMDLSKAFDCISHKLLISKLHAYGVSNESCSLIMSYLCDRKQRVKLGQHKSEWARLSKGVPQGSILGPLLFNVFVNDLFYSLQEKCPLYNYADDNTLSMWGKTLEDVIRSLTESSVISIEWFEENYMQANPSKFQFFLINRTPEISHNEIEIRNEKIPLDVSAKLLGVHIDSQLNFDAHITKICTRVSLRLNAIGRISKYLDENSRMKLFHSFILSEFQYCNTVWHFCSRKNIIKMEKLHKRAMQIVLNDYQLSYTQLLCRMRRPSLYISRVKCIAVETYKCLNGLNPAFLSDMFHVNETRYNLRDPHKLIQPNVCTEKYGLNSFRYEGAKIWNQLPADIKSAPNLFCFKAAINAWPGPTCECRHCVLCSVNNI